MILRRIAGGIGRRLRGRQPVILMYHRIAEPDVDPWGLAVPPTLFAQQLAALGASRQVLAMDEFVARLSAGDLPGDAAAITFDDGYVDNFVTAKPILEAAGTPATMFLTTGAIGTGKPFWWDRLMWMVLNREAPLETSITLETREFRIDLPARLPQEGHWRAEDGPRTPRQRLYLDLWRFLQAMPDDRRAIQLEKLIAIFGAPAVAPEDLPMSAGQAAQLSSAIVSVGAHTLSHTPLTRLAPEECARQIAQSREDCRALTGQLPSGFAFPHGERNAAVIEAVRAAGFAWACSTAETAVDRARADVHDLPRIAVGRWSGEELVGRLG